MSFAASFSRLLTASLVIRAIASPSPLVPPTRRGDSTPCTIGEANDVPNPRTAFFRNVVDASTYSEHDRVPTPAGTPLKVGIIGAGAAGLYAAMLLDSLNIDYDIYEASERVGGRIYTYRFSESDDPTDPAYYDYYDVGAMRFPPMPYMDRVIGSQSCALIPYINSHISDDSPSVDQIHYIFAANNTLRKFNGVTALNQQGTSPALFGVDLGDSTFDNEDIGTLWKNEVAGLAANLSIDFTNGFDQLMDLDKFTAREWLREQGFTMGQIDWMETINDATGHYDMYAMSQAVLEEWIFTSTDINNWTAINGGMGKLIDGMYEVVKNKPIMSSRVTDITKNADDTLSLTVNGATQDYAHIISTVPLGALQAINTTGLDLTYFQQSAIRELQYDPSMKIGMKFKTRWWEDLPTGAFQGGQSYTDMPIRRPVYPSYGIDVTGAPGTMIASYTWGQDAARLGAYLNPHDVEAQAPTQATSLQHLVDLTLADLASLHGVGLDFLQEQLEGTHAYDWYQSENSVGAFAIFGPGEFSGVMPYLMTPAAQGHMHFGGEALSSGHAWIIGAVNSAYRTVVEVLATENMTAELNTFVDTWGLIDEVDMGWYKWTPQD